MKSLQQLVKVAHYFLDTRISKFHKLDQANSLILEINQKQHPAPVFSRKGLIWSDKAWRRSDGGFTTLVAHITRLPKMEALNLLRSAKSLGFISATSIVSSCLSWLLSPIRYPSHL